MEQRIAASIEKRTRSNAAAVAINNQPSTSTTATAEVETEILGTYEYLDHTADIQIHSWGTSLEIALEQLVLAMFGYMTTSLSTVEVNAQESAEFGADVKAKGHDVTSMVFAFLQEWLEVFHTSGGFIPRYVTVHSMDITPQSCVVVSSGQGETMKPEKHPLGTEVKAVTYSNLQVQEQKQKPQSDGGQDEENSTRFDIWVILDI